MVVIGHIKRGDILIKDNFENWDTDYLYVVSAIYEPDNAKGEHLYKIKVVKVKYMNNENEKPVFKKYDTMWELIDENDNILKDRTIKFSKDEYTLADNKIIGGKIKKIIQKIS